MTARRMWRTAAWVFTVSSALGACALPFLRWRPRLSFDVVGVLWLLMNTPHLFVWGLVISLAILALCCWIRSLLAED